ncbi:MAG: hypothetical protein ACO4AI_15545 [Prochlorothrix sp.]
MGHGDRLGIIVGANGENPVGGDPMAEFPQAAFREQLTTVENSDPVAEFLRFVYQMGS